MSNTHHSESRTIVALALIFGLRLCGPFMILPVFMLYAHHLEGATPTLMGLALGIYGLTQALLQIPLGLMSDRWGRKPVITAGLLIFATGSLLAACSHSIVGVILGRALQGAGAVGSTLIALVADLTREEIRTKAMAAIGLTIGTTFSLGLVLGPVLMNHFHMNGIFTLTAILALLALYLLHRFVPTPLKFSRHLDAETSPKRLLSVLKNTQLLRLDLGILVQHAMLTALFVVLPIMLKQKAHLAAQQQWQLYLPILVVAFITMVPFIIFAEKKRHLKGVFLGAIAILLIAQLVLWHGQSNLYTVGFALWLFFTAFNLLEATLPSLISKLAPVDSKGTAMGIYSSSQFFGIFIGGFVGGWIAQHNPAAIYLVGAGLAGLWLIVAASMQDPPYLSSLMVNLEKLPPEPMMALVEKLKHTPGVAECFFNAEHGVAYLKFDSQQTDRQTILSISSNMKQQFAGNG